MPIACNASTELSNDYYILFIIDIIQAQSKHIRSTQSRRNRMKHTVSSVARAIQNSDAMRWYARIVLMSAYTTHNRTER